MRSGGLRASRAAARQLAATSTLSSSCLVSCARRAFFSFPSVSRSLVKSHSDTKRVPFSPAEMFDVVADVNRYKEFLPFCVDSRVLRRPNDNVMEAALRVGFKLFTESYTSRVIMKRPEKIVVKAIESPTFKRIESEWVFHATEDPNACVIDFKVTFEVASFLHANAIQLFFDDVAVAQLSAFIERARRIYGAHPRATAAAAAPPPPESQGESTFPIPATITGPTRPVGWSTPATPTPSAAAAEGTPHSASPAGSHYASDDRVRGMGGLTAAQRAAESVKTSMSAQHFQDFEALFARYAVDNGKMYLSGFEQACRALSGEYHDFRAVSESSALAGAVFSSLSTSAQPKEWLDLDEFVAGVYLMARGSIEEKAQSLFHAIDTLCDGKISREELTTAMQRRMRTVKKIFPMLLQDQVELQMQNENVAALGADPAAAMTRAVAAMETLMEEVEKEIPLAVNQIFQEADLNQDDFITQDEWLYAWQTHPEFVELMTIDGMKKFAQWASVVQADGDGDADGKEAVDTRLTHVD